MVAKVRDGEAAEVRRGLQVDCQRAVPRRMPVGFGDVVRDAFVDAGIVDQHVDPPHALHCRIPDPPRCAGVHEIARDQLVAAPRGMAYDIVAAGLEQRIGRGADAAARSGDQDVHAHAD
jgi:hypothetical protein